MSTAPNYTPGTSFADDETNNVAGRSIVKTSSLDSELADISSSINVMNTNLQALQRDDNKLKDGIIEPYALSEQTNSLIATAGCNPRGTWTQNTDYKFKDVVQRSNIAQICMQDHNSGTTFTQALWLPISGDGTSAANAASAAASAAAALSSQNGASVSATNANASAISASNSANSASTSATNASNSETSAATSASSASSNANAADQSAQDAAAAASSIVAMVKQSTDPTHASNSDNNPVTAAWSKAIALAWGQTYQNVTASRAINTLYTNSTNKPIWVDVYVTSTGASQLLVEVAGVTLYGPNSGSSASGFPYTKSFPVPAGATYRVLSGNYTLTQWIELRT